MAINMSMPVDLVKRMSLDINDTDKNGLFGFWGAEPFYYQQ